MLQHGQRTYRCQMAVRCTGLDEAAGDPSRQSMHAHRRSTATFLRLHRATGRIMAHSSNGQEPGL